MKHNAPKKQFMTFVGKAGPANRGQTRPAVVSQKKLSSNVLPQHRGGMPRPASAKPSRRDAEPGASVAKKTDTYTPGMFEGHRSGSEGAGHHYGMMHSASHGDPHGADGSVHSSKKRY